MNLKNAEICNRIDSLARAKGINIAQLEREIGFGNGKIGKWKNSPKSPTYDSLAVIASYFDTTVAYLVGETDDLSAIVKKERPADGEALVRDLPEDIRQIIQICKAHPDLASALLAVARQIEKAQAGQG